MASPLRSWSPVAAERPKANGNNGLRKSFNVNVFPKAPPSRNSNQSSCTPANSPADYPQRASPFKDFNVPARQSEEIGLENVRPCPPKSAAAKSPAPKTKKNFMAPTFSAASKAASPKKRVLAERNESIVSPSQTAAKVQTKSPFVIARTHLMDVVASCESVMEDTHMKENGEAPIDSMEVDRVRSVPEPEICNVVRRALFEVSEASEDNDSLSFLSRFPDPGEECATVLPPYDPKRNYLSPRPDFLRYRPNRGLDIDVTEDEEGFEKHEFLISETPAESVVTEIKEMESLGEQMASVGISTEVNGHGEIQEEVQAKMAAVGCSEQNPFNPNQGFEPKKNALEQAEASYDNSDEEEEEQKQSSRWLRTSLLFAFVLLCASVALLRSGSPGLLPPFLHDNALARGEFYGSAVDTVKGVDAILRSNVKDVGFSVLRYSRIKYEIMVKNVKSWFASSGNKLEMPTEMPREDVLQNSFENRHTGATEQTCSVLDMGIGLDDDIKRNILPSELLVDSVGDEDFKGEKCNGEVILEDFGPTPVKDVARIPPKYFSNVTNVQENTGVGVLHKNPRLSFPSDLQEDENKVGVQRSGDSMIFSSSNVEVYADLEKPFSSVSDIEEEKGAHGTGDFAAFSSPSLEAYDDLEEPFSFFSDIEEEMGVHGSGDFMAFSSPSFEVYDDLEEQFSFFSDIEEETGVRGDIVAFSTQSFEVYADLEEPFSFLSNIEEEKEAQGKIEDMPEVQNEETKNVFEKENIPEVLEATLISNPADIFSSIIVQDSQVNREDDASEKQSRAAFKDPSKGVSYHESQNAGDYKFLTENIESTKSNEHSISHGNVPKESPLFSGEHSKASEVQVSAIGRRDARDLLPIGTKSVLSIIVAAVIAAIFFASASRKRGKISGKVVAEKPNVEFIAKKVPQRDNCYYSPPPEPTEKTYSGMHFSSSNISPPQVQFLAEYLPEEVSSSDRNTRRMNAQENSFQTYERRFRKGNSFSSATPQEYAVTSEFSSDSPSYGSFTTYEKIARKEGGGDEEPKIMKVVTPVRRS
ncbi:hypothetical protein KI387_012654, partial [Taxus chinensis]